MITDHQELSDIRNALDKDYVIGNDILMPPNYDFPPIGSASSPFTGTLDGGGRTIRNLNIQVTDPAAPAGLFGVVELSDKEIVAVWNLALQDPSITGAGSDVGAFAGSLKTGTVKNIAALGGSVSAAGDYAGGIAGRVGAEGGIGQKSRNVGRAGSELYRRFGGRERGLCEREVCRLSNGLRRLNGRSGRI